MKVFFIVGMFKLMISEEGKVSSYDGYYGERERRVGRIFLNFIFI